MKVLLIGDFGGYLPEKLVEAISQEEFDVVLCNGDYCDISKIKKAFLEHGDGYHDVFSEEELVEIRRHGLESAQPILEWLDSLQAPVLSVNGNNEVGRFDEFLEQAEDIDIVWLLDVAVEFEDLYIVGLQELFSEEEEDAELLMQLFEDDRETILLTHYPPYECELDLLPEDNPLNPGMHIGREDVRELIDEKQPEICVCGHLEEYQGECKVGRTRVINPGAAHDGKYAILTITDSLAKAKVEFKQS